MSRFERLDRLSLPRRARRWRRKARLQDEENDRSLEAYKITALTFAWGPIGQTLTSIPAMPTVLSVTATVARGGDARKGKQSPKADRDRKFIIEPHFAGRKSLM